MGERTPVGLIRTPIGVPWRAIRPVGPMIRSWARRLPESWINEVDGLTRTLGLGQPGAATGLFDLRETQRLLLPRQSLRPPRRFALLTFALQSLDLVYHRIVVIRWLRSGRRQWLNLDWSRRIRRWSIAEMNLTLIVNPAEQLTGCARVHGHEESQ